jgi:hypothetical protein
MHYMALPCVAIYCRTRAAASQTARPPPVFASAAPASASSFSAASASWRTAASAAAFTTWPSRPQHSAWCGTPRRGAGGRGHPRGIARRLQRSQRGRGRLLRVRRPLRRLRHCAGARAQRGAAGRRAAVILVRAHRQPARRCTPHRALAALRIEAGGGGLAQPTCCQFHLHEPGCAHLGSRVELAGKPSRWAMELCCWRRVVSPATNRPA